MNAFLLGLAKGYVNNRSLNNNDTTLGNTRYDQMSNSQEKASEVSSRIIKQINEQKIPSDNYRIPGYRNPKDSNFRALQLDKDSLTLGSANGGNENYCPNYGETGYGATNFEPVVK